MSGAVISPAKTRRAAFCVVVVLAGLLAAPGTAAAPGQKQSTSSEAGGDKRRAQPGRRDLRRASLFQAGRKLVLTITSARPVALRKLDRRPDARRRASRFLCLEMRPLGRRGRRRLCLGGQRKPARVAGAETLNAAGGMTGSEAISAHVKRHGARTLVATVEPGLAGLRPRRYRWRVVANRPGCRRPRCPASLPARGLRSFRLRPVRAVGCTGGRAGKVNHGPRGRRVVALTFDDGPSDYTGDVLNILREKDVDGTFFVVGQEIDGREKTMRRMLAEGSEIGNHTTHHGAYPGYSDLAETNSRIEAATHFRPCVFRPPEGAVNSAVVSAAGEARLKTVMWDVDPVDWSNPGSGAIYSRVVDRVRPGSIVLLHDGGGNRSGTVAALPEIIDTLRGRGYSFATVSDLLGHQVLYRPYG